MANLLKACSVEEEDFTVHLSELSQPFEVGRQRSELPVGTLVSYRGAPDVLREVAEDCDVKESSSKLKAPEVGRTARVPGPSPRNRIKYKFLANLLKIKRDYKRIGQTLFLCSYTEYLRVRENKAGKYEVELAQDYTLWKAMARDYISALTLLPSSRQWASISWVGSTAIRGLLAKPIIDLMIQTDTGVEETLLHIAEEMSWTKLPIDLTFPIGFFGTQCGVDWGFLQMPHYHSAQKGLLECNLHIFPNGAECATEKIRMGKFLNSEAGSALRLKYSNLKVELEAQIKKGELETNEYNKGKHMLITEINAAAAEWDIHRSAAGVVTPQCSSGSVIV